MGTIIRDTHPDPEGATFIAWGIRNRQPEALANVADAWRQVLQGIILGAAQNRKLIAAQEPDVQLPEPLANEPSSHDFAWELTRFYPLEDRPAPTQQEVAGIRTELDDLQRRAAIDFRGTCATPQHIARLVLPPRDVVVRPGQLWVPEPADLAVPFRKLGF